MVNISWSITVVNELDEIMKLINHLHPLIHEDDEILIQYDEDGVTEEVLDYLKVIENLHEDIKVISFPLNDNFGKFKSNLSKYATKEYITQLDADEIPSEYMVRTLGVVLERNNVDLLFVPRINTVDGLTLSNVKDWGWNITKMDSQVNEKVMDTNSEEYKLLEKYGLIISENNENDNIVVKYYKPINQFPDYQSRVYRNTDEVKWLGKVHESITGYNNFSNLPAEERWCLYHHKGIERQEKQNEYYSKL